MRDAEDINSGGARAVIVYRSVPHYRVPFYEQLRERLKQNGVELLLVYGQPNGSAVRKRDTSKLSWGKEIHNYVVSLPGGRELYWQPCLRFLREGDLVIVEQASKLLVNYLLLAAQRFGWIRLAFWGHGRNFQGHIASGLGERIKRVVSTRSHWWFAYNELSARAVTTLGYPSDRITSVNNTIDTSNLRHARAATSQEQLVALRTRLGIKGKHVAIYSGSLYGEKRLPFLMSAAATIRERIPDFEIIVLGAGPEEHIVEAAAQEYPWIHRVGPIFGEEAVPYFLIASVLLMPGLVGLAVIDSFVHRVPLVTVDLDFHSPEIQYLSDNVNGLLLRAGATPPEYAAAVADLMLDEGRMERLRRGCDEASAIWTMEAMVDNFARGILSALAIK